MAINAVQTLDARQALLECVQALPLDLQTGWPLPALSFLRLFLTKKGQGHLKIRIFFLCRTPPQVLGIEVKNTQTSEELLAGIKKKKQENEKKK